MYKGSFQSIKKKEQETAWSILWDKKNIEKLRSKWANKREVIEEDPDESVCSPKKNKMSKAEAEV